MNCLPFSLILCGSFAALFFIDIAITHDTTEADLKQRSEIRGGSLYHVDQAPVRAATHGRILILEGLEKAERNVLPSLNNLLVCFVLDRL